MIRSLILTALFLVLIQGFLAMEEITGIVHTIVQDNFQNKQEFDRFALFEF